MLAVIFKPGGKQRSGSRLAFALLVSFLVSYGYVFAASVASEVLPQDERNAMQWVSANTPANSSFAIVTGQDWAGDVTSEWFPVLSQRQSLATVQGFEWFPNRQFFDRRTRHEMLQACGQKDVTCLTTWAQQNRIDLSFVYLGDDFSQQSPLQQSLAASPQFELVYPGPGPKIYRKRTNAF